MSIIDCTDCETACCEITLQPMGIPVHCIHLDGMLCSIHETKPFACKLYPFVLVADGEEILLAIDTNCLRYEQADLKEALEFIESYAEEAVIFEQEEVDVYGFKLRLIGKAND